MEPKKKMNSHKLIYEWSKSPKNGYLYNVSILTIYLEVHRFVQPTKVQSR